MKVTGGSAWPTGGTPPIANPVLARTNAASARSIRSPNAAATAFSLTRLAPLAITRTGRFDGTARKISDFAICPTEQPIAAAASAAVRVVSGNSTTSASWPRSRRARRTRSALGRSGGAVTAGTLIRQLARPPRGRGDGPGHQRLQPVRRHQDLEGLERRPPRAGYVLAQHGGRLGGAVCECPRPALGVAGARRRACRR